MAWCNSCGRTGLAKKDVELDEETRQIVCHSCMVLLHPGWAPPIEAEVIDRKDGQLDYEVHFTNRDGFTGRLSYGGNMLELRVPMFEINKMLGKSITVVR